MRNILTVCGGIVALGLLLAAPISAHSGALDANGCHYQKNVGGYHCHRDGAPNPDVNAPVKKSRVNICHDAASPNYKTLKYFISYPDMGACIKSGGNPYRK